jgi:hypothetical protein
VFWTPAIAPAAVGYILPVPGRDIQTLRIDAEDLTVIGTQDGPMCVRLPSGALVVLDANSLQGPVGILVPLDDHWAARIDMLNALRAQMSGRKKPPTPLTPQQRRRIRLALRTLDARQGRASYQTIARHLFGAEAVSREHWKTSSLKAQITRLSAHGAHLTTKGYRFLLLGRGPTGRSKPRK